MQGENHQGANRHDGDPGQGIAAWLCSAGADTNSETGPVSSLGRHLRDAGLMLDGLLFHVGTLHPEIFAKILVWTPDGGMQVYGRDDLTTIAAGFPGSPFRQAAAEGKRLALQNVDSQFLCRAGAMRHRDAGELVCAPFRDCDGRTVIASFCIARPNTFSAADHHIIDRAIASLRQGRRRERPHSHERYCHRPA